MLYIANDLLRDILLQASQTLLGSLEDIVVFADRKAEIVLSNVGVGISVELRRRNGGNANLVDKEPAELEVAGAIGNVGWEGIVCWELDGGEVDENKVSALGIRVLQRMNLARSNKSLTESHTGRPSSSKTSQNSLILFCMSVRLSSQKPSSSAFSKATAAASWRGETLL